MIKRTTHPQNQMITWPLYLPQIYWVVIRNSHIDKIRGMILDGSLVEWENQFFAALEKLHFKIVRPIKGYWSEDFNNAVLKSIKKEGNFSSKRMTKDFLIKHAENGPLAMNGATDGRIDRKITPPAEAIGLINLGLDDDSPTKFFYSLLPPETTGQKAVALLVAKIFGLSESTFEFMKHPPRVMLLDQLSGKLKDSKEYLEKSLPNEHSEATYNAYVNSTSEWFDLAQNSEAANQISKLMSLIPIIKSPMNESWRDQIPEQSVVQAILSLIGVQSTSNSKNANPGVHNMKMKTKNIILVGPPGTGKSKAASLIALELTNGENITEETIQTIEQSPPKSLKGEPNAINILWTQFHPSYSYEDFVEGIRPVSNLHDISKVRYAIVPGPLKALAQLARVYCWDKIDPKEHYMIPILCYLDNSSKTIGIPKEYSIYNLPNREGILHLKESDGTLIALAKTGGGKIEALISLLGDEPRHYQELYWTPSQLEVPQFVLVIDEINRGNTAKIFGELLSVIEPSKRLGENDCIEVSLAYSKEPFSLPPNLHIVSTMNQADRSLSVMDQAFRRRFKLIYLKPNFDLIRSKTLYEKCSEKNQYNKDVNEPIAQHFENINKALGKCDILDSQHIGHSYAFEVADAVLAGKIKIEDALVNTWNSELHSLIHEILPESSLETFLENFLEIEKENPSVKLKDFETSFKRSTPNYLAA